MYGGLACDIRRGCFRSGHLRARLSTSIAVTGKEGCAVAKKKDKKKDKKKGKKKGKKGKK